REVSPLSLHDALPIFEDVSEAIPEQAEGQDRDENGCAGSEDGPRVRQEKLLVGLDHRAPLGYVEGHADSDEGNRRERDDDGANVDRKSTRLNSSHEWI